MNEVIGPFFMSIYLNLCVTIGINTLRKYKKYKKLESNDNNIRDKNFNECEPFKIILTGGPFYIITITLIKHHHYINISY